MVVSKTFTTAETMLNARTVRKWLVDGIKGAAKEAIIRQHMIAVRYIRSVLIALCQNLSECCVCRCTIHSIRLILLPTLHFFC